MIKSLLLRVSPQDAHSDDSLAEYLSAELNIPKNQITGIRRIRQSVDARGKQVMFQIQAEVFINEPFYKTEIKKINFKNVSSAEQVIIVGAGPGGIFAALKLIENGIKPIILERGKNVSARRRDLATLMKERIVNPESNYCFGEGGAGTYSDGKLYTRSTKRGDVERILHLFVAHGADERILYEAHPHIVTNKLPQIITAMRKTITDHGGEFHFNSKVTELLIEDSVCTGVKLSSGEKVEGKAVILATGHSARDIFFMLQRQNILIEAKPFAIGVRIEHPQELIDKIQYHLPVSRQSLVDSGQLPEKKQLSTNNYQLTSRGAYLPPASYSLVHNVNGRGVFSFCMCPGGIIAPSMTNQNEIVVNGWSPSRRNNPYANSGLVVSIDEKDFAKSVVSSQLSVVKQLSTNNYQLAGLEFQQSVEEKAFIAGGKNLKAPAQRITDFLKGKTSSSLPKNSYFIGTTSVDLREVLPKFISDALKEGLIAFGKKMPARQGGNGYITEEAIMVGVESRTSSPVRIPRDKETLQHPQIKNLYPCGEGAGYAGGIVSAAMDGERVAEKISPLP